MLKFSARLGPLESVEDRLAVGNITVLAVAPGQLWLPDSGCEQVVDWLAVDWLAVDCLRLDAALELHPFDITHDWPRFRTEMPVQAWRLVGVSLRKAGDARDRFVTAVAFECFASTWLGNSAAAISGRS